MRTIVENEGEEEKEEKKDEKSVSLKAKSIAFAKKMKCCSESWIIILFWFVFIFHKLKIKQSTKKHHSFFFSSNSILYNSALFST